VAATWRRLANRAFAHLPWLTELWLARHPQRQEPEPPLARPRCPLGEARVGLVTTGGVHLAGQPPFDTSDPDGDPGWRVLPGSTPADDLRISHAYYDSGPARRDLNLVYPLQRLGELAAAGLIGGLVERHAGLMGHVDGRHLATLRQRTAPDVAELFVDQRADIVLLVPA
jgi:D-proline reductase (dithiol) PrdB